MNDDFSRSRGGVFACLQYDWLIFSDLQQPGTRHKEESHAKPAEVADIAEEALAF